MFSKTLELLSEASKKLISGIKFIALRILFNIECALVFNIKDFFSFVKRILPRFDKQFNRIANFFAWIENLLFPNHTSVSSHINSRRYHKKSTYLKTSLTSIRSHRYHQYYQQYKIRQFLYQSTLYDFLAKRHQHLSLKFEDFESLSNFYPSSMDLLKHSFDYILSLYGYLIGYGSTCGYKKTFDPYYYQLIRTQRFPLKISLAALSPERFYYAKNNEDSFDKYYEADCKFPTHLLTVLENRALHGYSDAMEQLVKIYHREKIYQRRKYLENYHTYYASLCPDPSLIEKIIDNKYTLRQLEIKQQFWERALRRKKHTGLDAKTKLVDCAMMYNKDTLLLIAKTQTPIAPIAAYIRAQIEEVLPTEKKPLLFALSLYHDSATKGFIPSQERFTYLKSLRLKKARKST